MMNRIEQMWPHDRGTAGCGGFTLAKFRLTGRYLLPLVPVLYFACAHIVAPSGGPKDEKPPEILRANPPTGTLNHPVNKPVAVTFSEWVDVQSVKKSITVFPTLPDGFTVTAVGKRVEIRPETEFAESTTYHIGLTTALSDVHGVAVRTPKSIFFSTGPFIDSGEVTGCVTDTQKLAVQPKAALYRCDGGSCPDTAFLALPHYLIQTDSAGHFTFTHIRRGTYALCAFSDENNDNRLTAGKERVFVPQRRFFTLDRHSGPFELFPAAGDTAAVRVVSVKAIAPAVLFCEWGSEVASGARADTVGWRIISLDKKQKAPSVSAYLPVRGARLFYLRLSAPLTTGSYSLVAPGISRIFRDSARADAATGPAARNDTLRFNGAAVPDTVRPGLKSGEPSGEGVIRNTDIRFTWTKPVRPLFSELTVSDSLGDSVPCVADSGFAMTTVLRPRRPFLAERKYTVSVAARMFEDAAGNFPRIASKDSADTGVAFREKENGNRLIVFSFTTLLVKDMCFRLSGGAACLGDNPDRVWFFSRFGSQKHIFSADSAGFFHFDSIPGCKGRAGYFIDGDHDGSYSPGSLFPWRAPEESAIFPDTIEARVRWEIEGISVPACSVCGANDTQDTVIQLQRQ